MKKHKDSLNPEDWKRIARKDWLRVKRNLGENDIEAAGFFLQQSLEKYLKAFLLQYRWKLRQIHALHDLLSDAVNYNSSLEPFRKLGERVSGYYFIDRYPALVPFKLTSKDIERDMKEAQKFIQLMFPEEKIDS